MQRRFISGDRGLHLALALVFVFMACGKEGANASLAPYVGPPPTIPLSSSDKLKLDRGQSVDATTDTGSGGRAVKIFRVNASANNVWSVILDFEKYPKWIDSLTETRIYKKENKNLFVEFHLYGGMLVGTYIYHINHTYTPGSDWLTWTLDETPGLQNDIKGSVGYWRVTPVEGANGKKCDVTYSIDVELGGLASLVKGILVDRGLEEATGWVKQQSEKRAR